MNKKEQIAFLEEMLRDTYKQRLQGEYQYRVASSQQMSLGNGDKGDAERMAGMMTQARKGNDILESQIRHIKSVIEDINNGQLTL